MGLRGPAAVPTRLKLLRGNPGKQKLLQGEPQPARLTEPPEPLSELDSEAAKVWNKLAPELTRMKLVTVVDLNAFGVYCTAVARLHKAEAQLANEELRTKGSTGQLVINPLVSIARDAARDVIVYGREFGLTPSARVKLVATGYKEPEDFGKFTGLIGGAA